MRVLVGWVAGWVLGACGSASEPVDRTRVARGVAAAGAFLRDRGIIEGKLASIDDVLLALHRFDAWPAVQVPQESYVNAPHEPSLADLNPALRADGETARFTLVYRLGEPRLPQNGPSDGNEVGGMDPDFKPTYIQPIARCTLTIPRAGDAAWTIEHVDRVP